jgi:hypothetical protein
MTVSSRFGSNLPSIKPTFHRQDNRHERTHTNRAMSAFRALVPGRAPRELSHAFVVAVDPIICEAIRTRSILKFEYHGQERVVAPYCHGIGSRGVELLRAIQIAGSSSSGGFGFGKLWRVPEMSKLQVLDEHFIASDPHYNPEDSAMSVVHCRV